MTEYINSLREKEGGGWRERERGREGGREGGKEGRKSVPANVLPLVTIKSAPKVSGSQNSVRRPKWERG